ncbi:MAG: 4Fe-4S binding protein [Candidatus Thermoplasmatota archaeon]|nr:4Fe-4S binding protein [Candidatus Thermoplasmatota archaeon]
MSADYKGRNIRPLRVVFQLGAFAFFIGQLLGLPPFGTEPVLRRVFLPNAACRYMNTAPTSCFYYQLQDSLAHGASDLFASALIMLLVVILLVLVLGRTWCSWLCPFGFVQELFSDLRELVGIPFLRMGFASRVLLRRVKYAILILTVLITVPLGISALGLAGCTGALSLPFCQVCPAKGFFTIFQQILGLEPWSTRLPLLAWASLLIFLGTNVFMRMPFCRICPMGGLMALFAGGSMIYLKKDPDRCTKCRICLRVCPMDHDRVYEEMGRIDVGGEDCTLCARCVEMCPEEGCLSLAAGPFVLVTSRPPKKVGLGRIFQRIRGNDR